MSENPYKVTETKIATYKEAYHYLMREMQVYDLKVLSVSDVTTHSNIKVEKFIYALDMYKGGILRFFDSIDKPPFMNFHIDADGFSVELTECRMGEVDLRFIILKAGKVSAHINTTKPKVTIEGGIE